MGHSFRADSFYLTYSCLGRIQLCLIFIPVLVFPQQLLFHAMNKDIVTVHSCPDKYKCTKQCHNNAIKLPYIRHTQQTEKKQDSGSQ